jgi:hypothetical protein
MELDELKAAWAAHDARVTRLLAIHEHLLHDRQLGKARRALAPYVVQRALEAVCAAALLVACAPVVVGHAGEPRYLFAGGAALLVVVGALAGCISLLAAALGIDYAQPVLAIQRDLEALRLRDARVTAWAILGGITVWAPIGLVGLEAIGGPPLLGAVDLAWLVVNLALGVAVAIAAIAWAKRSPRRGRLVDALSGRAPRAAAAHLAELAVFEAG